MTIENSVNTVAGSEQDKALQDTTRLWAMPFLYEARGYLLAHLRTAQRGAERDELERMQQAIYFAIQNWKD